MEGRDVGQERTHYIVGVDSDEGADAEMYFFKLCVRRGFFFAIFTNFPGDGNVHI